MRRRGGGGARLAGLGGVSRRQGRGHARGRVWRPGARRRHVVGRAVRVRRGDERYVSLASIVAAAALPIGTLLLDGRPSDHARGLRARGAGDLAASGEHRRASSTGNESRVGQATRDRTPEGTIRRVAVLGSGGWGTALAVHLARAGHEWACGRATRRSSPTCTRAVPTRCTCPTYACRRRAPDGRSRRRHWPARGSSSSAVPSHGVREIARQVAHVTVPATTVVVSATKGLEQESLYRMSEVLEQELGAGVKVAVLSGPSFASEVARELPTAMAVASRDGRSWTSCRRSSGPPTSGLYGTADVIGRRDRRRAEERDRHRRRLVEGLGLGHNAQAGLITRGLAEMTRLACAAGAQRETLAGLAGLGDLVLTCTRGRAATGVWAWSWRAAGRCRRSWTARAWWPKACGRRTRPWRWPPATATELPIASQVADLLAGRKSPRTALDQLMVPPAARRRRNRSTRGVSSIGCATGLSRTKEQLLGRFEELVEKSDAAEQRTRPIDVETIEALEELLLSADVGVAATERIVIAVRGRARRGESLRDLVKDEIRARLRRRGPDRRARPPPARDARRRREWHRQDDHGREAGQPAEGVGPEAAGVCSRHVPRGRRRAARGVGDAGRRRHRAGQGRRGSRRRRVRCDQDRGGPRAAIPSSWTRQGACTRG